MKFISKLIRKWTNWRFPRRVGSFSSISFPIIRNMPKDFSMKDFMDIQPMMSSETKQFYMEYYDVSNPRIGQIFFDKYKYSEHSNCPPLTCCVQERWSRIWTPTGWVYEKEDKVVFEAAVKKYSPIYKSQVKEERELWNKEHNITDEDFHIPTSFVFDSQKKRI